jgi:CubicO group peptidase (beta-lactamase class C family)
MKRLIVIAAIISASFASSTICEPACVAQTVPVKDSGATSLTGKSSQVDRLLAPFNQGQTPGVAALVIQDGQIVHHKGYGLARLYTKEPIGPDTAFDLASMSKPFTAMAVMILAERGKLSYDDPLSKFFPDFPAYAQKVTIRNLLTHTSGLVDVISAKWFRQGYEPTSRELAKLINQEPNLKSAPGEKFAYNNAGYLLLALIVEKASGQSFPVFMRDSVFKPLGMNHSLIWDETKPKVEHLALSYSPEDNSFKSIDYVSDKFLYGPKGVITTTTDLSKWNEALDSEKLVKVATLRLAYTPMKLNDGSESPYGFGWSISKDNGLAIIEHPGGYLGYRTDIRRYPNQHTTIIVLSNNAQVVSQALAKSIEHVYLSDKMVAPAAKVTVDPTVLSSYVGKYEGDPTAMPNLIIEISLENGELYITSPLRPKTKLLAQTPTEFIVSESSATATFNKGENGSVMGLTLKTRMGVINARRLPTTGP